MEKEIMVVVHCDTEKKELLEALLAVCISAVKMVRKNQELIND